MTDDCPNCGKPSIGGQIVELPHPSTDEVTYAVTCPHCSTVFRSQEARRQVIGE